VFKANTPGAWLYPDAMDSDRLVGVAEQCPSGAITYVRRDGRPAERPPLVNVVRIRENGPYAVHADIDLSGHGRMTRATLCRCGASSNKPFCDDSHKTIGFMASGEPKTRLSEPPATRGGTLVITPQSNGPLTVSGSVEVCAGTGRTVDRVKSVRLCRCGGSRSKPFCDGTHAHIGFNAP
jgi:CDGSH-type Zn-finger protein